MSDSGKSKRNRKNRGNRRKNKNKETGEPATVAAADNECAHRTLEVRSLPEDKGEEVRPLENIEKESASGARRPFVDGGAGVRVDLGNTSSFETLLDITKRKANYQVEFPKLPEISKEKKKIQNYKSKSLDNDDDSELHITDITGTELKSDDEKLAESSAIISEAESDVEWEVADDLLEDRKQHLQKIKGQLSVETVPLQIADTEEVNSLSPEDELNLRNFLQSLNLSTSSAEPPVLPARCPDIPDIPDIVMEHVEDNESENDMKQRRARKKAALEEHFLPQFVHPRFLDVIDEEGSNESSDTTRRQSFLSENRDLQQRFDDVDDDVFINEKRAKEPIDVFPKKKDYFACKKELKRQQECLLVGAKILETDVEEGCGDWTIEKVEEQRGADIVYLDDSSSSASEVDNGGDTDFINEDERVTIKTPTIDIDNFYSDSDSKIPLFSLLKDDKEKSQRSEIPDNKIDGVTDPAKAMDLLRSPKAVMSRNDEISESLESLLVLPPVPAACNEVIIMANEFMDELPIVTEVLNESRLSQRNGEETNGDSQAAESDFNTNLSGIEDTASENTLIRTEVPNTLKEICLTKVASLPYGESILEELAAASKSIKFLKESVLNDNWKDRAPSAMPFFPSPDLSAVKKAALIHRASKPSAVQAEKVPPPIAPRQSSFKVLREEPPWVGLATQADPSLLACLSPSQKNQIERTKNTANDEAGELIDMHCKYAERRGYHERETSARAERAPPSNNTGDNCSPGSANRLLAIIRDPQLNPDAERGPSDRRSPPRSTFDFVETLRSFEDLNNKLAKEEKSMSVTKNSDKLNENIEITETYTSNKSFKANVKKISDDTQIFKDKMKFSDFFPGKEQITPQDEKDSSHSDYSTTNKNNTKHLRNSMGNLNSRHEEATSHIQRFHNKRAFLLDDPIFNTFTERVKQSSASFQNGAPQRRSSLPKDIHDRQIAYIIQKEKEIEEQIRQLEDQKRTNNFDVRKQTSGPRAPMMKDTDFPTEKYNISRQRDIAIIQQEIDEQFMSSVSRTERPASTVSTPSNGEKFRDQMYSEYMDKVAEREERKHHKVIKISNSQDCPKGTSVSDSLNDPKQVCNKIEEEFISKAKMRWDKLGFKDPETEDENEVDVKTKSEGDNNKPVVIEHKIKVIEGDEEKDVQKLSKHLQEFVKFTSSGDEAGVWTPGAPTSAATFKKVTSGNSLPTTSGLQNGGVSPSKALAATQPPTKPSRTESIESQSQTSVRVTSSLSNGVGEKQTSVNVRDSSPSGPPPPPPPPLPVWKPKSQPPSPAQERKEFKPVAFDSPTLARKKLQEQSTPQAPPPWEARLAGSQSAPAAPGLSGLAGPPAPPPPPPPTLPRAQNPTITLLQKAREGQLPRGAAYLQQDREREPPRDRRSPPRYDQGEIVYTLKRDYASDTESGNSRRRMEPKKYEGIGPTTREGMPIVLRSEVKEGNQSKWYKKMYDTIHRNKFDEDYVTVRYKSRRAHPSALHAGPRQTQYAYFDPRSGYLSEPEGGRAGWASDAYDSDASAKPPGRRHSTLDRRGKENEANEYLPNVSKYSTLASAKASQEVYKNQPGRIEDYIPGRSSVVDKEAKQWWDEVMDIFDGQLANASTNHPQINNKQSVSSSAISKSYMARALKESGYESDSTLVFRRRGVTGDMDSAPLSPREQRQAYREVQAGGEPPLHGFRKPAPDRPKDPELAPIPPPKGINSSYLSESPRRYVESDVNIHYRVPVRQEPRPLVPEEELARRQADHMRRVYQEERRRKYLQELQDMNSRRHTDNFTPAQKSPISLNRYDTFGLTGQVRPHQVARALHNFTGQSPRELSFRRGELILVRRRIDQNWFEGEHDGQVGLFPANYVELLDDSSPNQGRPTEGRARAKFNFVAQTHLELGLKKGELVVLVRRVDDNWYEGKLGGRKGIFPVSYVEVLVEPQVNRAELAPSLSSGKPVASPAAHSVTGAAGAASLGAHHYTPQINNPNLSNSPSSTAPLTLPSHGISNHHARPASATLPRASDPSPVNLNNHEPLFVDTNAEAVPYRAMYKYRPQNPDELELQEGDTVYVLEKCDDGWYVGSSQRTGRFGTFPGNYVDKI